MIWNVLYKSSCNSPFVQVLHQQIAGWVGGQDLCWWPTLICYLRLARTNLDNPWPAVVISDHLWASLSTYDNLRKPHQNLTASDNFEQYPTIFRTKYIQKKSVLWHFYRPCGQMLPGYILCSVINQWYGQHGSGNYQEIKATWLCSLEDHAKYSGRTNAQWWV